MKTQKSIYEDSVCLECGNDCQVIIIDESFDYSGTHCTGGNDGTHYQYSDPCSDCCHGEVESVEEYNFW